MEDEVFNLVDGPALAHEKAEARRGVFTDVGEAVLIPPQWVIRGVLPVGITFIAGPPKKARKSSIETALALSVAGYKHKVLPANMQIVDRRGLVMGWSAEALAGEVRHMIEEGMNVKLHNDDSFLIADDPWKWRLDDEDGLDKLMRWLDEYKPRLFFIDPLRDFHSLEEKDDGDMNRLLRPLQQWAKREEAAFVVVHHTRKRGQDKTSHLDNDDMRGSGSLPGLCDGMIIITPLNDGRLHIKATFKRGEEWERDISLGMWGEKCGGEASLSDVDARVFAAHVAGAESYIQIARQLGCSKSTVVQSVAVLIGVGAMVRKPDKSVAVARGGEHIVKSLMGET